MVVGAVEGTWPRPLGPIRRRTLHGNAAVKPGPGTAADGPRPHLARLPERGPAGVFGEEDCVRGAVGNGDHPRHAVRHQDTVVIPCRQGRIDIPNGGIVPTSALAAVESERAAVIVPIL